MVTEKLVTGDLAIDVNRLGTSPQFRVIKIDPDGSGTDWKNHLGATIKNAQRCCVRCTVIFGELGDSGVEIGPFVRDELEPLNDGARQIHDGIEVFVNEK